MKLAKYRILVVDDDSDNLDSTRGVLELWDYQVDTAESGEQALGLLRSPGADYAVILLDYCMPGMNGAQVAAAIRQFNQEAVIAMYSHDDSQAAAIGSFRAGAIDFIDKEGDPDALRRAVAKACEKFEEQRTIKPSRPEGEAARLIASIGMVGRSEALAAVVRKAILYRGSDAPVLITGESGVGKELIAQALHTGKNNFVAINCASFKDGNQIVESELFGHEKGAFTGATERKLGLFESALGGTVFLDEIHHMSLAAQAQLLRALQEKKIRRVGGRQEYAVQFRLIAATKPDIEERAPRGEFLSDLYYRINSLRIDVPALRDRPEDIEPLVQFYSDQHARKTGKAHRFMARTVWMLERYPWPGNVRELGGYVEKLLTECESDVVAPTQLDHRFFPGGSSRATRFAELELQQERERREFIEGALRGSRSVAQAAKRIGIPATTLKSMLGKLGVRKEGIIKPAGGF